MKIALVAGGTPLAMAWAMPGMYSYVMTTSQNARADLMSGAWSMCTPISRNMEIRQSQRWREDVGAWSLGARCSWSWRISQ